MFRRRRRYIDESIDTQFTDAWIVLALILGIIGLVSDNTFFTAALFLLLVLLAVAWCWSTLSLMGLEYRRVYGETRAFLGEEISLTLEVKNRKPLPLTWLTVRDIFPAALSMEDTVVTLNRATNQGEFRTFWMPNAFQSLTRHFVVRCTERGYHRYGPARLETGDGFGFFKRTATMPTEQTLIVYPRIYSVAELDLPAKSPFGERGGLDFLFEDPLRTVGVREWASGDDPRRIHWKATARHQQLLSRIYEPSRDRQILIFLNVATFERHWHGTIPDLLERTISVAASLASLTSEGAAPVGLIANGTLPGSDQPIRLLPGRSPDQMTRILELLAAVTPFASHPIEELLVRESPRLPWGATVVIVTAIVHDELLATIYDLVEAGRRIVLFTLAEKPPEHLLSRVTVYHLPHLVEDLIEPRRVDTGAKHSNIRRRARQLEDARGCLAHTS